MTMLGHLFGWLLVAGGVNQAWRAGGWCWRRWLRSRAPFFPDVLGASRWATLHPGRMARFPRGEVRQVRSTQRDSTMETTVLRAGAVDGGDEWWQR